MTGNWKVETFHLLTCYQIGSLFVFLEICHKQESNKIYNFDPRGHYCWNIAKNITKLSSYFKTTSHIQISDFGSSLPKYLLLNEIMVNNFLSLFINKFVHFNQMFGFSTFSNFFVCCNCIVLYIVTYLKRYSERFFIGPALLLKGTEQKQLVKTLRKIETEVTYSLVHEFFFK